MTAHNQRANVRVAAQALAEQKGWTYKQDGDAWRRVVPSPTPLRIFELRPVKWLLDQVPSLLDGTAGTTVEPEVAGEIETG